MTNRLLSKKAVLEIVGVSAPTLWQWQRQGLFPRSVKLQPDAGFSKIAFLASEVEDWIASRPRVVLKGDKSKQKAGRKR